jgi:hydrogenase/urease accessory protein HupE
MVPTMKPLRLRVLALTTSLLAAPSLALAHPGHDGDHGLTWEFSHLAAHPFATVLCGAVLVTAVIGVAWLARHQSLRKSAANRGK